MWSRDADVYYRRFDGTRWLKPRYVGGELVRKADLAVGDDGTVHLVWFENWTRLSEDETGEVFYTWIGSPDWGYADNVGATMDSTSYACIVAGQGGAVDVVWRMDMRDGYKVLYHQGVRPTWGPGRIAVASMDSIGVASLAGDAAGELHLVWCDHRQGNWEIYYSWFDGAGWGAGECLTDTPGASIEPSIAGGDGGSVHLVWVEMDGALSRIFHAVRKDMAWGVPEPVTEGPGGARTPRVAIDREGRTHVVWTDDRDGSRQVYYRAKTATVWSEPIQVTDSAGDTGNPGIAVDTAGLVHVVWHDNREGKNRVYWKALYPGEIPRPRPEALEPASAFSGDVIDTLRISGTGFVAPATAWMAKRGEPQVPLDSVRVISPDEITCAVDLLRVHHGDWDVVVENPNGSRDTLRSGFSITPFSKPLARSLEPGSMESNLGLYVQDFLGANFVSPAAVWLDRTGEERLTAVQTNVKSSDTLEFAVSLDGAAPGLWNVVVENPDGRQDTIPGGFRVLPAAWSRDVRLTHDAGGSMTGYSHSRTVAVDDEGKVHVVWYDDRSGHYEIYYKVLLETGWSPDIRLTLDDAVSAHPAIAIGPGGSVHVVWHDRRHGGQSAIYYKELTGPAWSSDQRISTSDTGALRPSVAVDTNGDVHVVWYEARKGWHVTYRKRVGGEWQEEVAITESPGSHEFASVAVDDLGSVHVVWHGKFSESDGRSQIYYARFDDGIWRPSVRLSYVGDDCLIPSVATGPGGTVHIVWHDACDEDDCEIHYTVWDGSDWQPSEAIALAPGRSRNACIAVDASGAVHLAWQDDRGLSQEMYYKFRDGDKWSDDVRLNATQGYPRKPSIAAEASGRVHVVWHDDRDGNWEIYYKSREARTRPLPPLKRVILRRIAPNPTVGPCAVYAEVDGVGAVEVDVYDVSGRHVWEGRRTTFVPGLVSLVWDGYGRDGRPVAPGVYFVQVSALRSTASAKIVVLR
jgi:hypothetical protein